MSSSDSTPKSPPEECMSCRIISTATLGGTGVYVWRAAGPGTPGSVFGKTIMRIFGVGVWS
ncbi:hypothetical protein M422DRAFT_159515 [Sphaerobolus stellatus SS14]|nr:hypothetical protein M422DRAFT_159515 [Sphaerobolus stellatus SS14]